MEVQALVVGLAGFAGYYLRGDPKIEVTAPVSPIGPSNTWSAILPH